MQRITVVGIKFRVQKLDKPYMNQSSSNTRYPLNSSVEIVPYYGKSAMHPSVLPFVE